MGDQIARGKLVLFLYKLKPYLTMISLQFGFAGMYIISMVGLKRGMNHFVLAVYRHLIALAATAPFALILERKIRPKLTLPILLRIMAIAFLEPVFAQNVYYMGMAYTSATFAAATANVLPAVTFILALIFRIEKINFKKIPSVAKLIGTVISLTGALVMICYKGPIVEIIRGQTPSHHITTSSSTEQHWMTGTFLLLIRCCGWGGFFILQSFTLKLYPAELSLTALICLMGALEGAVATFIFERNMSVWVIGWDSRLFAAAYSGVVCTGIAYYVQGIVIKERGPVFMTAFSPLALIITAAGAAIILAEQIHLGSLFGTILIVIGLYAVVWGKSKDHTASSLLIEDEKVVALELPITVDNKTDGTGPPGDFKVPIKAQESC